ncbi:MAG: hypothetical protein M0Z36_05010 [Thermaerobacter sp.]|nr:hypothetical protein [Thermaerobacter sp.]
MVRLQSIDWVRDAWELRFLVHEGVYQLDGYPVRISHLAFTRDEREREALGTVVTSLLQRHMRRGAVPPHAMVLDWGRARRICEGGSSDVVQACKIVESSGLVEVGGAVSNHF